MGNTQSKINKLIMALKAKGKIVGINTEQFYAEDSQKIITKYKIGEISELAEADKRVISTLNRKLKSKKTSQEEKENILNEIECLQEEFKEKYVTGVFYSKINIVKFLADWYKKIGESSG